MDNLTLLFAIIFCGLVLVLKPANALGVYFASLIWYPNYLMVSIGTIDISLGRFVVGFLLLRCLIDPQISSHRPKWCGLDSLILLSMAAYTLPYFITHPFGQAFENRAGFLMDSLFAYAVVRFVITDYTKLTKIIKIVSILLVPLAVLGVLEAFTGFRPFSILFVRSEFFSHLAQYEARLGLNRAFGPFSHSILFGCTFGLFLPLIYYLRNERGPWHYYAIILSLIAAVGALSSMSSGPWVLVGILIICLVMERAKQWIKVILLFLVVSLVLVEIVSNRPLYHVIASYANPLGGSGWHRAKLIDLAIARADEWWLVGYGSKDPGWGEALGMTMTDITNEFILAAVRYGIWGLTALCAVLIGAFRYIFRIYHKTTCQPIKSLSWAFGSMLVALVICWMSVSFFGQLIPLFYCMLGMIGSFYVFSERRNFYVVPAERRVKKIQSKCRTKPVQLNSPVAN